MSDFVLAKIDQARRLLAEAKTVQEAKQIADVAEAARIYAKRVEASIITVNHAAEIKIRAERLLGEMLKQTPKDRSKRAYTLRCDYCGVVFEERMFPDEFATRERRPAAKHVCTSLSCTLKNAVENLAACRPHVPPFVSFV